MGEDCVVCGEASEGKPLYKKLGNGDHAVDVFDALRDLELMILDDSAKTSSYICWDCDELVNEEYGRYVKDNAGRPAKGKQTKKKGKKSNATDSPQGGSVPPLRLSGIQKNMIKTTPATARKNKKAPTKQPTIPGETAKLSKWKIKELERAANKFHGQHCLMCGNEFEHRESGFWRYSLKKVVFDKMDIAQVMEALGMARQVTPQLKGKRFVCCSCFYTIRRSYKSKQIQGSIASEGPSTPTISFHRATAEEHAAEIAKLLPPELATCYNIVTPTNEKQSNGGSIRPKANGNLDANERSDAVPVVNGENISPGTANTVPDLATLAPELLPVAVEAIVSNAGGSIEDNQIQPVQGIEEETIAPDTPLPQINNEVNLQSPPKTPVTSKSPARTQLRGRKKNVLLPKRSHEHLNNVKLDASVSDKKGNIDAACNICGISHERPQSWWFNINSPITDFESISVAVALKLLESSFSTVSSSSKSVCPSCFNRISDGFKFQVRQKIAEQKGVDLSEVQLSKVKVRMLEPSGEDVDQEESSPSDSSASARNSKRKKKSTPSNSTEENTSQNINSEPASQTSTALENKAIAASSISEKNSSDVESTTRKRHLSAESELNVMKEKVDSNQKKSSLKRLRLNNDYDLEDNTPKFLKTEHRHSFLPPKSLLKSPVKANSNYKENDKMASPNIKVKMDHQLSPIIKKNTKDSNLRNHRQQTKRKSIRFKDEYPDDKISKNLSPKVGKNIPSENYESEKLGYILGSNTEIENCNSFVPPKSLFKSQIKGKSSSPKNNCVKDESHQNETDQNLSENIDDNNILESDNLDNMSGYSSDEGYDTGQVGELERSPASRALIAEAKAATPVVRLRDINELLPQDAFDGVSVSLSDIQAKKNIDSLSKLSDINKNQKKILNSVQANKNSNSSSQSSDTNKSKPELLQINENSNSITQRLDIGDKLTNTPESIQANKSSESQSESFDSSENQTDSSEPVHGICLACNYNYLVTPEFWRSIHDLIKPPKLQVSIKWACVALNQKLPTAKKKDEKVCRHCFHLLQKKFQLFVQSKVARSYGVEPDDVCLDDFVISFDQTSMNIVAEPIPEDTPEMASAKALGEQVWELTDCLSLDDVVCGRGDQPLEDRQFTIALLLLLNEVRVQIGASLGELNKWLSSLMPLSFKEQGLKPCETNIARLLRSLTKDDKTPNLQGLKQCIPKSAFVATTTSSSKKNDTEKLKSKNVDINKEAPTNMEESEKGSSTELKSVNKFDKKSLDSFAYFNEYVNLDKLMNNSASPVAISDFKQHLLYSLWKYKLMIRAGDDSVISWIQQLCPVSLNQPSLEKLVQAAKSLYKHMQENPQDHEKLNLPLLVQKPPADTNSKSEENMSKSLEDTTCNSPIDTSGKSPVETVGKSHVDTSGKSHVDTSGKSHVDTISKSPKGTIRKPAADTNKKSSADTNSKSKKEQFPSSSTSLDSTKTSTKTSPKKCEIVSNNNSKSLSAQKIKNVKAVKRKRSLKGNDVASSKSNENETKPDSSNLENDQSRVTDLEVQSMNCKISKKSSINSPDKEDKCHKTSYSKTRALKLTATSNNMPGSSLKSYTDLQVGQEKNVFDRTEVINGDSNERIISSSPSKTKRSVNKELKNKKYINSMKNNYDAEDSHQSSSDKPFNFVKNCDLVSEDSEIGDNGEDNELALKVQELERQLKEVKQQNMKLLEFTQSNIVAQNHRHVNNNNHMATQQAPKSAAMANVNKVPTSMTFGMHKETQYKKVNINKKNTSTFPNDINNSSGSSDTNSNNNSSHNYLNDTNDTNDTKSKEKIDASLNKISEHPKHVPTPLPVKKKPKMLFEELMNYDG